MLGISMIMGQRHVRNAVIALAAIISCGATASSQAHYNSKFSIGGHAGITMSKMSFTPSVKESMVMGQMA